MTTKLDDALSDRLAAALDDLASGCRTAAGVARKLAEAGCAGERGSSDCCPVTGWLAGKLALPPGVTLCAGIDSTEIVTGTCDSGPVIAAAVTPQVISSFIVGFDGGGLYGELARAAGDPR